MLSSLSNWYNETFSKVLPNLIQSLIIFIIMLAVLKLVKHVMHKELSKKPDQKHKTLFSVLSGAVKFIIYFTGITMILDLYGIDTKSLLTLAGVGSFAVGFGAQTLIKDVISGLFVITENQYNIDDVVEIADVIGTVVQVGLRTTHIRTTKGELCIIPNGEIRVVRNLSRDYMNAILDLDLSSHQDTDQVLKKIEEALKSFYIEESMLTPITVAGITELNRDILRIRLIGKCHSGKNWDVESRLRLYMLDFIKQEDIKLARNLDGITVNV